MVEPIAGAVVSGAVSSDAPRVAATTPAAPVAAPAAPSTPTATPSQAQTSGLARSLAASAPVDSDRVATVKKAIAEGRFPILPATIADRLIAFKLHWNPDEAGHEPQQSQA